MQSNGLDPIEVSGINVTDPPRVVWVRVRDAYERLWGNNPKQHDIGAIITSLKRHGLKDLPVFDANIGIQSGNGRIEGLYYMERDSMERPRGVGEIEDTGHWVVPLVVGVDAESRARAESYAIDANNLSMMGGEFTAVDVARMYDPKAYAAVLLSLKQVDDELPVSVDGDDLELLLKLSAQDDPFSDEGPLFFDVTDLPDVPEAQGDYKSHIIYVTFPSQEDFVEGLRVLTLGDRGMQTPGQRYAHVEGMAFMEAWTRLLGEAEETDES